MSAALFGPAIGDERVDEELHRMVGDHRQNRQRADGQREVRADHQRLLAAGEGDGDRVGPRNAEGPTMLAGRASRAVMCTTVTAATISDHVVAARGSRCVRPTSSVSPQLTAPISTMVRTPNWANKTERFLVARGPTCRAVATAAGPGRATIGSTISRIRPTTIARVVDFRADAREQPEPAGHDQEAGRGW